MSQSMIEDVPGTEYLVDVNRSLNVAHASGNASDIVMIPQPSTCTGDPLLWSRWKKYYQLFLVALYACAFSFGENTLGAAWSTVSEDTHVTLTNMNAGSALNYLLLGFCNIFWIPAAKKLGNRFVFLLTTLICMSAGIWLGEFHGTGSWMGAQVLNGLGTSAYQAVIQLTIFNMFFVHERGRMLAVYLFGQQLGSILGLISGGSIADGPGWRWSQYIVAIIDGSVFVLLFFSFEETMFPRFLFSSTSPDHIESTVAPGSGSGDMTDEKSDEKVDLENTNAKETPRSTTSEASPSSLFPKRTYLQTLTLWVYQPEDTTTYWEYFKRPFFLWTFPTAVIPGFIFAFGCTAGIVSFNTISEILSSAPYDFSSTTVGLICFATLIGSIVGYFTGVASDYVVLFLTRRNKGVKEPEMRLWTLIASFIYAALGYMLYGWGAQTQASWIAIAFGLGAMIAQQVSACTIATAYAMECFPGLAGELVVILAMCSSMINFAISYSVQPFINATGYGWAFFFFGMCVLVSICGGVVLMIQGKNWRRKCAPRYYQYINETGPEVLVS